jgi:hypothetical protein
LHTFEFVVYTKKLGLFFGISLGVVFIIALMADLEQMMRYRSAKLVLILIINYLFFVVTYSCFFVAPCGSGIKSKV